MQIGDLTPIERRSVWHLPIVSASEFAGTVNLAEASVRQYVSKKDGFPVPTGASRGNANLWTWAQVYDYRAHVQQTRNGIPGLFPWTQLPVSSGGAANLAPARFEAAERLSRYLSQPEAAPWDNPVVHYWTPSDARGTPLAVVYLASDAEIGRWDARDLAVDAARFLHERAIASVVVVITDEADRPVPNSESELQRTVVVAEVGDRVWLPMNTLSPPTWPSRRSWRSSQSDLDADPSTSVYDLGWCDLLYLLRVELPWWPVGSRCVDVIAGWPRAH